MAVPKHALDPAKQQEQRQFLDEKLQPQRDQAEALAACRAGLGPCPYALELRVLLGTTLREMGQLSEAESCRLQILQQHSEAGSGRTTPAALLANARHQLALGYQAQKRHTEAETQWRAVLAQWPDTLAARVGLANVWLEQGRWSDVESAIGHLEQHPHGAMESTLLRTRLLIARQEYPAAQQLLETSLRTHAHELWLRVALSHAYLREGRDLIAAERALRAVLELDPQNAEARHNLDVLLHERSQQASV